MSVQVGSLTQSVAARTRHAVIVKVLRPIGARQLAQVHEVDADSISSDGAVLLLCRQCGATIAAGVSDTLRGVAVRCPACREWSAID
jgi:hypothetical protein